MLAGQTLSRIHTMKRLLTLSRLVGVVAALLLAISSTVRAEDSFAQVAEKVNKKLAKLFGSGGFRGLAHYGTGVVVSSDGYVLTIYSHLLDTQDLRVHLWDGIRYHAKVVAIEPELDVALVKIDAGKDKLELGEDQYFDVAQAAKHPLAEPGTGVLAFSNQFEIATRGEPMSVQRGVISAYTKLHGRIGIYEASYTGDVYVIDAITNNPGAAGGVVTSRKGELLGLIGKELRNELTNTWINYAVPINATREVIQKDGKKVAVSILDLVEKKDKYKPADTDPKAQGGGGYTGIVLVPNVVELTPPYVEEVEPNSPAAKAGLKPDDLIVYVDGLPVASIQKFQEVLKRYRPKTEIKLEVRRGDKLSTVSLTLGELPPTKIPRRKPVEEDK
jgi:serine protease Do